MSEIEELEGEIAYLKKDRDLLKQISAAVADYILSPKVGGHPQVDAYLKLRKAVSDTGWEREALEEKRRYE